MVPLSEFINEHQVLASKSHEIVSGTIGLFEKHGVAAITGRASTKRDLENRIDLFRQLFRSVIDA
jgi:hypothetical protein